MKKTPFLIGFLLIYTSNIFASQNILTTLINTYRLKGRNKSYIISNPNKSLNHTSMTLSLIPPTTSISAGCIITMATSSLIIGLSTAGGSIATTVLVTAIYKAKKYKQSQHSSYFYPIV